MPVRLRSAGLLLAAAQAACWQRVPTVNVLHRHLNRGAASYLRVGPPAAAAQAPESDSGMQSPPPPKVAPMEQLRLFWRLAKPYFTEAEGAKTGFALLLALTLLNSGVSVLFSYTSRDFYTALSSKDQSQFYVLTGRFALALAAATPVSVLYRFQRQRLAIAWREWMTMEVARQYYADRAYYQISLTKDIDNPDQRIAEDVKARRHAQSNSATRRATSASGLAPRSQRAIARTITRTALLQAFTRVSLDFFITLLTSIIDLASFSAILYSIYPDLFYVIIAYAGTAAPPHNLPRAARAQADVRVACRLADSGRDRDRA